MVYVSLNQKKIRRVVFQAEVISCLNGIVAGVVRGVFGLRQGWAELWSSM